MAQLTFSKDIIENSAAVLMNRIRTATGAVALQADIASVRVRVTDMTASPAVQVSTEITPAVSSVIYNTLQTNDIRYEGGDSTNPDGTTVSGYNFLIRVPGTYFPKGNNKYQVDIEFVPTSGADDKFTVIWILTTKNTYLNDDSELA